MAATSDIKIIYVKDSENLPFNQKLNAMLQTIVPPLTRQCCIFRVPKILRMIKESAYTPRVISIGPFHHNKDELQFMEKQKVRYLNHCIHNYHVNLDDLITNIKKWEESIRGSYGEHIELSSEDLVMMVLLDGLFVIEFFRRNYYPDLKDDNDKMLYQLKLGNYIYYDLMLLENQLPFFVLESLYNLVFPNTSSQLPFLKISCHFFSFWNKQDITPQVVKVLHFTDLMRMFHLPSSLPQIPTRSENDETCQLISSYCAIELIESGITFRASSSKCLLDIQFTVDDGVFMIPQLEIFDETDSVFRNIMALEQCMYIDNCYISDYVDLMDTLINTSKDVELLVQKGIISNYIGDHEKVAILFNNLHNEIFTLKNSCFYKIRQDSSNYYKNSWNKWRASFKRNYWSSPWQIASVIAAVVLLVLTLVQAICSIMQVLPLY